MILHHDELTLAKAYQQAHQFQELTDTQMRAIMARGRELFQWFKAHPWIHNGSLPWYQQIVLHRFVIGLLTPQQRAQFLITPVVGFPRLWWRLVRELNTFPPRP